MRRLLDVVDAVDAPHTFVVGPDSEVDPETVLAGRAEVVTVPTLAREVAPGRDARSLVDLVRLLRRLRPDVVHTHQAKAGLVGRVAARLAGVPVVYHSASMASFGPGYGSRESAVFRAAETATAPLVTRYFVVGRDLGDRLVEGARVPRRKLLVVRSHVDRAAFAAVDDQRRAAARARLGLAPDGAVVVFVGSLEDRKGVADLPAVMAAAGGPATLLVAGTGPRRPLLEAAAVPGVDIRLLGHVADVGGLMAAADAVVLPSSAEGVPQVGVQAAMVGVPLVAYDVDGVGELLDEGADGEVVALGEAADLGAAVRRALADPSRRGSRIQDSVWSAWSTDVIADHYREAYADDLSRARPRRRR